MRERNRPKSTHQRNYRACSARIDCKGRMDSRAVNRAIRATVGPYLKTRGFERWTDRNFGRRRPHSVEVVNFQSFNEYLAARVGCTTFSFALNLGIYFDSVRFLPWLKQPIPARPKEYECHARRRVASPPENGERRDIWYVDEEEATLRELIPLVVKALDEQAVAWFEEFSDLERALQAFETREESYLGGAISECLGGGLNSIQRATIASALALEIGDRARAVAAWERVISNPFCARMSDVLEHARSHIRDLDGGAGPGTRDQGDRS
jgi:hypothetical protein